MNYIVDSQILFRKVGEVYLDGNILAMLWQCCDNTCIMNIQDNRTVNKFRNIHISKCDLKALLAIKWKDVNKNADFSEP